MNGKLSDLDKMVSENGEQYGPRLAGRKPLVGEVRRELSKEIDVDLPVLRDEINEDNAVDF